MTRAASLASRYAVFMVAWILSSCGPSWLAAAQRRRSGGTSGGTSACTGLPCACSLRGNVALTTVEGIVPSNHNDNTKGTVIPVGSNVFGPFEAGFSSSQDNVLRSLGCADPSKAYSDGGRDTMVAVEEMAYQCGVQLPRREGDTYVNLLDECGGHTRTYHFHQSFICLYEETGTHSTQVAAHTDTLGNVHKLYGKWENFQLGDPEGLPLLDACGGHFGLEPGNSQETYHYHVQDKPPFTFGCYGPNAEGGLVTVEQCRGLYPTCDGVEVSFMAGYPTARTVLYDIDCPCWDGAGSNLGTVPLKVFESSSPGPTTSPTDFSATPVPTASNFSATPVPTVSNFPTTLPTNSPTASPTNSATPVPTASNFPTLPTNSPTASSTNSATPVPTESNFPTTLPTNSPTSTPANQPTLPAPTVAPTGPPQPRVTVGLTVTNLKYATLVEDASLLKSFKDACAEAIVQGHPNLDPHRDVSIEVSPGSVVVKAEITPPSESDAEELSEALVTTTGTQSMISNVVAKVSAVDGIDEAKASSEDISVPISSISAVLATVAPTMVPTVAPTVAPTMQPTTFLQLLEGSVSAGATPACTMDVLPLLLFAVAMVQ